MPWWGWTLIAVAVIIIVPIKLKIMKKMLSGKKQEFSDED